jgi:ERCC4-type nuclease
VVKNLPLEVQPLKTDLNSVPIAEDTLTILIDTREQKPLEFSVPTLRECLNVGDYSCRFDDGHVPPVVFERKSINDLYGSLSKNYERFKREIEESQRLGIKLIIIVESNLRKVLNGIPQSQRNGVSICYQLFTIRIRHGVETVFCTNRGEMCQYIFLTFRALKNEHNDKKQREGLPASFPTG